MEKSLWQWLLSFLRKLKPMPLVIKQDQEKAQQSQEKRIRRWWR